ncbi:unnamed protein product [Protopolystoma xenopodis]|uniref:Vps52 C-terminal domain-containing protein n=1 Tax=Protopolystoma xenopodis TaxID=117903 RepID=A0A3S5ARU8_9PLAT|nr:unnamed protein product [Protopolystoma xenopodis]
MLFRSLNFALLDTGCREYLFLCDFFLLSPGYLFQPPSSSPVSLFSQSSPSLTFASSSLNIDASERRVANGLGGGCNEADGRREGGNSEEKRPAASAPFSRQSGVAAAQMFDQVINLKQAFNLKYLLFLLEILF